jgi:hypothetical protein
MRPNLAPWRGTDPTTLNVKLPDACDRFLFPVKAPPVTHLTDSGAAYTATADAIDKANGRLSTAGACRRDERQAYAATPGGAK